VNHRQNEEGNEEFRLALLDLRLGLMSDRVHGLLRRCSRPLLAREPTRLFARNDDANSINTTRLEELPGAPQSFVAEDEVRVHPDLEGADCSEAKRQLERELSNMNNRAASHLHLKAGAKVMLIKNLHEPEFRGPQALVNGSVGTVKRFEREDDSLPHDELFPVVRFGNGRELLVAREHFETELSGRGTCVRRQVPLKLAWAMTVDKSQGATLEEVVVDLNHVGRSGQAYVALSRVTREAGLQVIPSARQWAPKASGLVGHFYDAIATGDDAVVADTGHKALCPVSLARFIRAY
jgi:ATP-dependent DNA helicase PIF1